ncbi:hypothetical protein SAMN05892883_3456 [Jatrophihabitans sp. GAS493]|uniref:hypothetical protein n=1 Tax=Jatrophihabitans sp. GAS493 TaxID=1907575 RepID=UPI000BB86C0D|nr:hypothetical protein [Jatrophihabitans sp. GAS493]SOD74274.1 hypothetical protein SAMN05892883_3456 [Jatrophihabitans sp. GAS493]
MLSVVAWVAILLLAVLATFWITFTLTRLDRLHARVDAAFAALDAQLVRRAAALLEAAESVSADEAGVSAGFDPAVLARVAIEALHAAPDRREVIENRVGRSIAELAENSALVSARAGAELHEACARLVIARRFYNDAVRDTRGLRARRMPRILHLAGHRELPQFFDIDDAFTYPVRAVQYRSKDVSVEESQ